MGKTPKAELPVREMLHGNYPANETYPAPQQAPVAPAYPDNHASSPHHDSERATTSRAIPESEALARDIKEGVLTGFIGSSAVVTGEASFKGMLRIDGRLTGQINSEKGTLIVSSGGVVEANIQVAEARINGTVNGDITATQRVELGRSAQVHGNIQTPALVIEQGAIFEGNCSMARSRSAQEKARAEKAQAERARAGQQAAADVNLSAGVQAKAPVVAGASDKAN